MSIFNHGLPPRVNVIQGEGGTDTSKDTVTAETMLKGVTAHDASGQPIEGTIPNYDGAITEGAVEGAQAKYEEGVAAGKKSEYDAFWDAYQDYGKRTKYELAFSGTGDNLGGSWTEEIFKPKYDIILGVGYTAEKIFYSNKIKDVPAILEKQGVIFDTTKAHHFQQSFQLSASKRWGVINASNALSFRSSFSYAECQTIEKLILNENCEISAAFVGCSRLTNLPVEGTIGQNGFNVQWSPLSHDSLMSIINALKDYSEDTSGTEWVVTLGSENIAKLTADELYIAEAKGWRVA